MLSRPPYAVAIAASAVLMSSSAHVEALPAFQTFPEATAHALNARYDDPVVHHHHRAHRRHYGHRAYPAPYAGSYEGAPSQPENPDGYVINRQGFGNYVPGPNGSFGGYPAGSAGAQELQENQLVKCTYVPESC